jgi:RNA polymerase sigma factor (sigma-70 family)
METPDPLIRDHAFSGHTLARQGLILRVEDDHELVLALRQQKPGAFDQLYADCGERVWRFLVRLAGAGAEDLFQETWFAAARNCHRLREGTRILPWLFTIARNKHKNGLRSWARRTRAGQDLRSLERRAEVPLDEQVHTLRQADRTRLAFACLPEAHREVLLLCLVEGLDTATVASTLACSEAAVRKRLSRARHELAKACGRQTQGDDP